MDLTKVCQLNFPTVVAEFRPCTKKEFTVLVDNTAFFYSLNDSNELHKPLIIGEHAIQVKYDVQLPFHSIYRGPFYRPYQAIGATEKQLYEFKAGIYTLKLVSIVPKKTFFKSIINNFSISTFYDEYRMEFLYKPYSK